MFVLYLVIPFSYRNSYKRDLRKLCYCIVDLDWAWLLARLPTVHWAWILGDFSQCVSISFGTREACRLASLFLQGVKNMNLLVLPSVPVHKISYICIRTCAFALYTLPKIRFICSQKWNCVSSFPIHTIMYLWAIYIFTGSVCLFGCSKIGRPILVIYKSLRDMNVEIGRQNIIILFWKWRGHAVSLLGIHKSEPEIYIVFIPALPLQCICDP